LLSVLNWTSKTKVQTIVERFRKLDCRNFKKVQTIVDFENRTVETKKKTQTIVERFRKLRTVET
jgi:hypothetical protein